MPGNARSGGDRKSRGGDDQFPADGLPSMPGDFTKEQAELWTQLMGQIPHQLLRGVDCYQLRILVETIIHGRRLEEMLRQDPADLPAHRAYLQIAQHISRLSSQFGLSPVDRKRLDYEEPIQDDAEEWANNN